MHSKCKHFLENFFNRKPNLENFNIEKYSSLIGGPLSSEGLPANLEYEKK